MIDLTPNSRGETNTITNQSVAGLGFSQQIASFAKVRDSETKQYCRELSEQTSQNFLNQTSNSTLRNTTLNRTNNSGTRAQTQKPKKAKKEAKLNIHDWLKQPEQGSMSRILKSFVLPADELSDDDVGAPPKEKDLAARLAQKKKHDEYMEALKQALQ